jgi:hypothetical protein
LTTANITNEADWAASLKLSVQRAVVVESYLKQQLALLGVTGYTITAVGSGAAIPVSSIATAAGQATEPQSGGHRYLMMLADGTEQCNPLAQVT